MEFVDTAIIGAGPAGSAAAELLARNGHSVALIDKATFPRDKCCGDGLTTLALRLLDEMGFDPSGVASWTPVDGGTICSPRGRRIDVPLPDSGGVYAAIARRTDLDSALVDFAIDAGAHGHFGRAVTGLDVTDDGVVVTMGDHHNIRAGTIVAADGMWSPTRKLLGLHTPDYRGEWHAFRQYFTDVGPTAATELWVWFEPDLLPGYMWSFPLGDGRANVGFGILRGGDVTTQEMKALWPDLLGRPHNREILGDSCVPEAPHRAWPIPARIDKAVLTGPRTLFVGDAAAACDVLTGEGIGQALLTGRQAAQALIDSSGDFDTAAQQYERAVRSELVADHKLAKALSRMLTSPNVAELSLRAVDSGDWTRRNFGRWMFEDYPRALVATPRRWKRGMFSAPGAYEN